MIRPGIAIDPATAGPSGPLDDDDFAAIVEVGRDDMERDRQFVEEVGHRFRPEEVETDFAVEQNGIAAAPQHKIGEAPDARTQQLAHHLGAVAQSALRDRRESRFASMSAA